MRRLRRFELWIAQGDKLDGAVNSKTVVGRFRLALTNRQIRLGIEIVEEIEEPISAAAVIGALVLVIIEQPRLALEEKRVGVLDPAGTEILVLGALESAA